MKGWLVLASEHAVILIEGMALLVVLYAAVEAFVQAVRYLLLRPEGLDGRKVWLRFSRLLVAGLTFQLAADIVETAVSTTWDRSVASQSSRWSGPSSTTSSRRTSTGSIARLKQIESGVPTGRRRTLMARGGGVSRAALQGQ